MWEQNESIRIRGDVMDPATISQLLGASGGMAPSFESSADSKAASQSGSIHDTVNIFGDQIVNGSKGLTWSTILMIGAVATTALILFKKKKAKA
jgi:hypothetical protein